MKTKTRILSNETPVLIADDLRVAVVGGVARLTPRQGLILAEDLIQRCTRKMVVDGIADARRALPVAALRRPQ